MEAASSRPLVDVPHELKPLLGRIQTALRPIDVWLFGSRARGDGRLDSDWDLLVVLPDDAPEPMMDPIVGWTIARESAVPSTVLVTRRSDLASIWGLPNTVGYDLAREGLRLLVG